MMTLGRSLAIIPFALWAATAGLDSTRAGSAESLYRTASARLAGGNVDQRRQAIGELEEAVRLAPDVARYQLALGRACLDAGFTARARTSLERAAALAPGDAEPRLGLGESWRRDWIAQLDPEALTRAVGSLADAARADPGRRDAWVRLSALCLAQGDLASATAAAVHALETGPGRADARLIAGCVAYRRGLVARAESLFTLAVPGLSPDLGARFADATLLMGEGERAALEGQDPGMREESLRQFWSQVDPDPTTPENEARLEYWSRLAYVSLAFLDPERPRWDVRAELFARYGAPKRMMHPQVDLEQERSLNRFSTIYNDWLNGPRRVGETHYYPFEAVVWDYPDLGMQVKLEDPTLSGQYRLPLSFNRSPEPRPSPAALARGDLLATSEGRAVFPVLPPGARSLPVSALVSHFEGDRGGRLLAHIEAPGTPVDELWARCVVLDSTSHEVARLERALSPSACDPAALRTADFAVDVKPGRYRVALSVRDGGGGRGVWRAEERVVESGASLSLSDMVVVCGTPRAATAATGVRLEPNIRGLIAGEEPLHAYFEVYHLQPGADGTTRFECRYVVRSEAEEARPWYRRVLSREAGEPRLEYRREDVNPDALRRQFISVPMKSLPPGRYLLEVRVRDLNSGRNVTRWARFERAGGPVAKK